MNHLQLILFSLSSSSSFLSFIIFNIIIMAIQKNSNTKPRKKKQNSLSSTILLPLLHFHSSSFYCKINLTFSSFEKSIKPFSVQSPPCLFFFLIQTFMKPIIINSIIIIHRIDQQISLVHCNFKRSLINN